MEKSWGLLVLPAALFIIWMAHPGDAAPVSLSMDGDEFYISVDPRDPEQGSLEMTGEVDVTVNNVLDSITVTLSVNITEYKAGEPTGRYWLGAATFDSSSIQQDTHVFRRNDDPAPFTITINPELYDPPRTLDIPVPAGLALDVEGRLVLKAEYSGAAEGTLTENVVIYPESYHLVNLSTPTDDVSLEAGDGLNYTLRVKNAGNNPENVLIEVPLLETLSQKGWTTSLSLSRRDGLVPGHEFTAILILKAPSKIERTEMLDLVMTAHTEDLDPVSEEPLCSSELTIKLQLVKSNTGNDDSADDDDSGEDEKTSPWALVLVIGLVIAVLIVLIILLFKKSGGGKEGENDPHESMFRI